MNIAAYIVKSISVSGTHNRGVKNSFPKANIQWWIVVNDEKLKAFLFRSGTQQEHPHSPLLFNTVLEMLDRDMAQKRNQIIKIEKKEVKPSCLQMTYLICRTS